MPHIALEVVANQCTGQPAYHADDDDPAHNPDCTLSSEALNVRASELQVFD